MATSISSIAKAVQLNNKLFLNTLNSIEYKDAIKQINEHTNSVLFIACHLIDARYYIINYLGGQKESPLRDILGYVSSIEDVIEYPPMEEVRRYWKTTFTLMHEKFESLTEEKLDEKSSIQFPISGDTVLDSITFLIEHESYHIGQMAFLRKYLGYGPMMYS